VCIRQSDGWIGLLYIIVPNRHRLHQPRGKNASHGTQDEIFMRSPEVVLVTPVYTDLNRADWLLGTTFIRYPFRV
jgi:hypothetical protein